MKRRDWAILTTLTFVVLSLVALNWPRILFGTAELLAEKRPVLLADAQWNDQSSARLFKTRFAPGTATTKLVEWLEQQDFSINADKFAAERKVFSFPCTERVTVSWSSDRDGRLATAEAKVQEAGCL